MTEILIAPRFEIKSVTRPVRLRSGAEQDLLGCAQYLNGKSSEAAIRFLDAFDSTAALLQRTPGIGGQCNMSNPLLEGIRVWPVSGFKNYLIYYRVLASEIEIVRILHAARDLEIAFRIS